MEKKLKTKNRTEYHSAYHAKNPAAGAARVHNQRCRERAAHFWAFRLIVYGHPLPDGYNTETREYKQAAEKIRRRMAKGEI